jgi:hypothetical protein
MHLQATGHKASLLLDSQGCGMAQLLNVQQFASKGHGNAQRII